MRHEHDYDDTTSAATICPIAGCGWNVDDTIDQEPWGEQQEQVNYLESRMDEWSPWDNEPDDIDRMGL